MTRLNVFLMLAVLASALYVVRTQYESRRIYMELEKANAQMLEAGTLDARIKPLRSRIRPRLAGSSSVRVKRTSP